MASIQKRELRVPRASRSASVWRSLVGIGLYVPCLLGPWGVPWGGKVFFDRGEWGLCEDGFR